MEYAVCAGYAVPAIRDISEYRMSWVTGVELARVSKDGPLEELPSDSPKKQREVRDQRLCSEALQRKVDTKVPVRTGIETGVRKADGAEGGESTDIRADVVIQRESRWVRLRNHYEDTTVTKEGKLTRRASASRSNEDLFWLWRAV